LRPPLATVPRNGQVFDGTVVAMLSPGDVAPDFMVNDHTGKPVSLKDLRGKTVVLWFYPKADTPG
jgi:peroxiredoxin